MGYVGTYDRTIFYNPSNKYCIISVKTSDQSVPQQARSAYRHRDNMIRFIAVGYELPQTDKVSMILDGEWENGKHGVQLQVDKCEEIVPQTKEGVYGYLSSRLIKGVGEKTAALIVNRFGANNVNKLDMLFALLAANGTEVIIEAEDMDKYHNAAVSKGASKIYLMARSHGLECRRLTWDPNYKGIDDWQLAMRQKKSEELLPK